MSLWVSGQNSKVIDTEIKKKINKSNKILFWNEIFFKNILKIKKSSIKIIKIGKSENIKVNLMLRPREKIKANKKTKLVLFKLLFRFLKYLIRI